MKMIKSLLLCAAASLASSAFAAWDGWSYYNGSSNAVYVSFGVDATILTDYYGTQSVGAYVGVWVDPSETVNCRELGEAEILNEYYWEGIEYCTINGIQPYTP